MNQRQESKLRSYKLVKELFSKNEEAMKPLPEASGLVVDFNENCEAIDELAEKQGIDKSGLRDAREVSLDALITAALRVSKQVVAYATVNEKPELLSQARLADSEIRHLPGIMVKPKVTAILDLALANADVLGPYGFTSETASTLSGLIQAYEQALPQPKMGIDETKQVTANLNLRFKRNDAILVKTDALVALLEDTQPDFCHSYENLRRMVTYGSGTLALKVQVSDKETGEGIEGVKAEIEEAEMEGNATKAGSELSKSVKYTAENGGFYVKSLIEGKYTLTVSKAGYKTQVLQMIVNNGEMCNVEIDLERE
ncbi:MAG: carboxypeptidase regulatory-like domain-containing protein [Bacteroidota bacterium]